MSVTDLLLSVTIVLTVVYALFLLILFFKQKDIIFPAPPKNILLYDKFKNLSLTLNHDNFEIQGWKVSAAKPLSDVVIIYFGGNGEDVAATIPSLERLPVSTIYTFNYRGYGLSSGTPSENSLYEDAMRIFNYVKTAHSGSKIAIIGYSLGSAVAGQLASKTDASYLILLAPLYNIERIAKENFGSLIPSWIVTNKFRLSETAQHIKAKVLFICAENDTVIPYSHSKDTYSNISSPKEIFVINNIGHNDIFTVQRTYDLIEGFLN